MLLLKIRFAIVCIAGRGFLANGNRHALLSAYRRMISRYILVIKAAKWLAAQNQFALGCSGGCCGGILAGPRVCFPLCWLVESQNDPPKNGLTVENFGIP